MFISLVLITPAELERYIKEIKDSNLSVMTKSGLIDLLKTAAEQTEQAKEVGWVNDKDLAIPI